MKRSGIILAVIAAVAGAAGIYSWQSQRGGFAEGSPPVRGTASPSTTIGQITDARIQNANAEPGLWLAHGRDYSEQRHSPLTRITRSNVRQLGLAWSFDMYATRALEATPIVVDGIMYMTGPWSVVYAVNAASGEEIWSFDPEVPGAWAAKACCDVVNRGVAVYEGAVYVATLDGRLVALNAQTGELIWDVNTIDRNRDYTITAAPRVARGLVFIGNGGAEYGVRGYVSAYDAKSGELVWRFYTVPGDPSKPFESPEMEMAAKTWKGGEWWKIGGGGTAWHSMVYDPDTDSLFIGVGNGSPWTRAIRSPGGGDNLFLSSIVALNAETGDMKWYYQTTPGDTWDYTATQDIILADLEVDGRERKVLMQAPKNGFFYVLDRTNGELLRAHPYVAVNWASHVDMRTGRPVERADQEWNKAGESRLILPGPLGGHNWQAMSFNPQTGLAYIPAIEAPFIYDLDADFKATGSYKRVEGGWNTGIEFGRLLISAESHPGALDPPKGYIKAFDPISGREAWAHEHGTHWNGGTLSTASGLVFQGNGDGYFTAYDARSGEILWSVNTYTSIISSPITYEIDGVQYVAIQVGSGGAALLSEGDRAAPGSARYGNQGVLHVFRLNGGGEIVRPEPRNQAIPMPPTTLEAFGATPERIGRGMENYMEACAVCHGIAVLGGSALPDLRKMSPQSHRLFQDIVLNGILAERGMVGFANRFSAEDVDNIYAFVLARSWQDFAAQEQAKAAAAAQ